MKSETPYMRKNYPSDITREQFKEIEPILNTARKKTRPREVDLYDVFCGLLYILKSCCQWRMLPSDFPKWQTVYSYFKIWKTQEDNGPSILEEVLKKIGRKRTYEEWKKWQIFFCNSGCSKR